MRPAIARILSALLVTMALISVGIALSGCVTRLPETTPGISGRVASMVQGDERPSSMLVVGGPQPAGAASDRAQVTINPGTMFFDLNGKPTKPNDISAGTKVRVWFDGAVAESYPVQGTAQAVQILGK